jgi:ABC-type enterochelin transport system permease subunit
MKHKTSVFLLLTALLMSVTSCEIIGGIFKAGMGVGIFLVLAVVGLIVFLIIRMRRKK